MQTIVAKEELAPNTYRLLVEAPEIAVKRKAGQFIILRVDAKGERVPLTIVDSDPAAGTITLVFQAVGVSTHKLAELEVGDNLHDLVGPLGRPTHIEKYGTCVVIGGGYGIAPVLPIAKALAAAGNEVVGINGARSKELVILEDELRQVCSRLEVCTDDGSYGHKGLVTDVLRMLINEGLKIDLVLAIGPAIMMKAVSELTKEYGIRTMVSLNSIMVDGTGMCGGCRVRVGGQNRFACVDGPEFDGHLVDFDLLMARQGMYGEQERAAWERYQRHRQEQCKLNRVASSE